MRGWALYLLSTLEPAMLTDYTDCVVAKFDDSDHNVRWQAVTTLRRKLEIATIAQYASALVSRLEDSDIRVRRLIMILLYKMELRPLRRTLAH